MTRYQVEVFSSSQYKGFIDSDMAAEHVRGALWDALEETEPEEHGLSKLEETIDSIRVTEVSK